MLDHSDDTWLTCDHYSCLEFGNSLDYNINRGNLNKSLSITSDTLNGRQPFLKQALIDNQ